MAPVGFADQSTMQYHSNNPKLSEVAQSTRIPNAARMTN